MNTNGNIRLAVSAAYLFNKIGLFIRAQYLSKSMISTVLAMLF
jgi:hypothetical protein